MLKAKIVTQTKVSARGYLEVHATLLTLLPLALMYGALRAKSRHMRYVLGGLALEALAYVYKIFLDDYTPAHGQNRSLDWTSMLAPLSQLHNMMGSGGSHRKAAHS